MVSPTDETCACAPVHQVTATWVSVWRKLSVWPYALARIASKKVPITSLELAGEVVKVARSLKLLSVARLARRPAVRAVVLGQCAVLVVLGPLAYAVGGWLDVVMALVMAAALAFGSVLGVLSLGDGVRRPGGIFGGVMASLVGALCFVVIIAPWAASAGNVFTFSTGDLGALMRAVAGGAMAGLFMRFPSALAVGLTHGVTFGTVRGLESYGIRAPRRAHVKLVVAVTLVCGIALGLVSSVIRPEASIPWIVAGGIAFWAGCAPAGEIADQLGETAGGSLGVWSRGSIRMFPAVWPYFRVMLVPAAAFCLGYALIVVAFGGLYAASYRAAPATSFSAVPVGALPGDFLYFSLMTMTTLGYAEMRPVVPATQAFVSLQVLAGSAWVVLGFAGFAAYLMPRFAHLEIVPSAPRPQPEGRVESQSSAHVPVATTNGTEP